MRFQKILFTAFVAYLAILAFPMHSVNAQATRIATVDVEKIQGEATDFQTAFKQLDEVRGEFEKRREEKERKLREITEDINRAEDAGARDRAESMRRELWKESSDFQDFMEETFGTDGIVETQAQELLAPLYDRLAKASRKVAEEHGFDLVLDVAELNPLFAAESLDITELVLRALEGQ